MIFNKNSKHEAMKKKKKGKLTIQDLIEGMIRLGFFLLYPALFSTAFTGIRRLAGQVASGESLSWDSFAATLLILIVFTIIFGRFFCGYACAFGTYGDMIYYLSSSIRKLMKRKPLHVFEKVSKVMRYLKYMVLLGVLILGIRGMDSVITENSPFTAFSRLHALKMPANTTGLAILGVITLFMALEPRFFCRFLCPMGAVFSLLPVLPFSVVKRDRENCIPGCSACSKICPASLEIPSFEEGDNGLSGECFSCGKCIRRCPRQNVRNIAGRSEWTFLTVLKALIFAGIIWYIYS